MEKRNPFGRMISFVTSKKPKIGITAKTDVLMSICTNAW
jgi:hypothetical protein